MIFKNKKKKERNKKLGAYVGRFGKICILAYVSVTLYTMAFDIGAIQKIKDSQYLIQNNWDEGLNTEDEKLAYLKSLGITKTPKEMEMVRDICLKEGRKPNDKKNPQTLSACKDFLPKYYAQSLSASRYDCTNKNIDYSDKTKEQLKRHIMICVSIRDYVDPDSVSKINQHVSKWWR